MSWSSGTNTIKEGGEAKNLTLQMLEVPKQSGGTELFVRKSDVTLGTKSISQNGTYTAASDGKYGLSQVSVNVRGGNGSADSSGKPSTSPNAPKPGGSGSAVVGTDPTTGNDQVVGVDESGNLVTTPLPRSIVLVTPPTKTTYQDGESIDLTGAVVVAKNADGTTWTSVDYPNGHIPLGELDVVPTTAIGSTIAVNWARPGDGMTLSDTFQISEGSISNLNTWQKSGFYDEIEFIAGHNRFTLHTWVGMDTLYKRVDVIPNRNYTFLARFNHADYQRGGSTLGYPDDPCIAVLSSTIRTYIGTDPSLIGMDGIPVGGGYCAVSFNSGNRSEVYLYFDFTGVEDNTAAYFDVSEIGLAGGSSGTTESSSGTSGSGGGGSF